MGSWSCLSQKGPENEEAFGSSPSFWSQTEVAANEWQAVFRKPVCPKGLDGRSGTFQRAPVFRTSVAARGRERGGPGKWLRAEGNRGRTLGSP